MDSPVRLEYRPYIFTDNNLSVCTFCEGQASPVRGIFSPPISLPSVGFLEA